MFLAIFLALSILRQVSHIDPYCIFPSDIPLEILGTWEPGREYVNFPNDGSVDPVFLVNSSIKACWTDGVWYNAKINSVQLKGAHYYFEIVWEIDEEKTVVRLLRKRPDIEWKIARGALVEAAKLTHDYSTQQARHPLQCKRDAEQEAPLFAHVVDEKDREYDDASFDFDLDAALKASVFERPNLRPRPKVLVNQLSSSFNSLRLNSLHLSTLFCYL